MNDYLGVPIKEGDTVTYPTDGMGMTSGMVIGFTPKKVRIRTSIGKWCGETTKFPHQLVSAEPTKEMYPEFAL